MTLEEARIYLSGPMATGSLTLFTGAGFSRGAVNTRGEQVPGVWELKELLWKLVASSDVDETMSLPDIYQAAYDGARGELSRVLKEQLTIEASSVPDWYEPWFQVPWRRAYTVNIDDLGEAAARRFSLHRRLMSQSALRSRTVEIGIAELLYVHLNGDIADIPDVTFSGPQYGERLAKPEPFWDWLQADLLASPIVFVGTSLDEPPLWQYMALRSNKGPRGTSEQRPRSLLISPSLPEPRERLLSGRNIRWVKADAEEFASEVLDKLQDERDEGHRRIASQSRDCAAALQLHPVTELAVAPAPEQSGYLGGAEPTWGDLQSHRVAPRVFEGSVDLKRPDAALLVTGTRGAGVSTTLMRFALRAAADGRRAFWVDHRGGAASEDLARAVSAERGGAIFFVDDADMFGRSLARVVSEFLSDSDGRTLVLGMRSSRIDDVLPGWPRDRREMEINVPKLEREDVRAVLAALEADNRLGELESLDPDERVLSLERESGRQLLVAMIKATQGKELEDKAKSEYTDLGPLHRRIYGSVALATDIRQRLEKRDLLVAANAQLNEGLDALDKMVLRGLLVDVDGTFRVRHRVIAELVVEAARRGGELRDLYVGLTSALALHYDASRRKSAQARAIRLLTSYRRLLRLLGPDDTRRYYQATEASLRSDHHYWLQRGSFEVHEDNLASARTYLANARGKSDNDPWVEIEWAYLLLKEACAEPEAAGAEDVWNEGEQILQDFITHDPRKSAHPFDILARQRLTWLFRPAVSRAERIEALEETTSMLDRGLRAHPGHPVLREVRERVRKAYLSTAAEK